MLVFVLFLLPRTTAICQEQEVSRESDQFLVSLSVPVFIALGPDTDFIGGAFGGTGSVRLTPRIWLGVSVRFWGTLVTLSDCSLFESRCLIQEETSATAVLTHADWFPFGELGAFLRSAAGVSYVREQAAAGAVFVEDRSWLATFLFGFGWDVRIRRHLHMTPLVEFLLPFVPESAARSTNEWELQFGIAATVR